ncbi:MAG: aspartate-semialdehyde dehydrogenase [Planctomycetota bacterium]
MSRVAVIGAGGAVGREMLALLAEEPLVDDAGEPYGAPLAFGSARTRGQTIPFGTESVRCGVLWEDSFEDVSIALLAAGGDISREWAPKLVDAGAVVIDNSSAFRLDPKVPLVVPEINADQISTGPGIIANPNCSTIILLLAVAPLVELGRFEIHAATYQAVSGAGKAGFEALTREKSGGEFRAGSPFPFPIDGNLFPLIGEVDETGVATEEAKMVEESRKILDQPELSVFVTCARVPVERCHSEAVTLRFDNPVDLAAAAERLRSASGVTFVEDPSVPPQPTDLAGAHDVAVGRLRQPAPHVLQFWVVGDQLLKGAALNAVQIARSWAARSATRPSAS